MRGLSHADSELAVTTDRTPSDSAEPPQDNISAGPPDTSQPARDRSRLARSPDVLEDRTLLTTLSLDEVAELMREETVTSATVITHGFQLLDSLGDSLLSLAQEIRQRADDENGSAATAWLLDYDLTGTPIDGVFDRGAIH